MTTNSKQLDSIIRDEIAAAGGHLSFARFMELALYHPQFGYYLANEFDIGKQGDFTTASELSPLYAQCFANQAREILAEIENGAILELGAGTGRFAGHCLRALKAQGLSPRYHIYEISSTLREKQSTLLAKEFSDIHSQVDWLTTLPPQHRGLIIANEVLDALPVTCFSIENDSIKERCVTWADNQFTFTTVTPSTILHDAVNTLLHDIPLADGYESEICLSAPQFVHDISHCLEQGVILFADYGYGEREYYHPERNKGSLTCFYQHHHHDNPLLHPGMQDITAHVDFTRIVSNAVDAGCELAGFTTQAGFLLNNHLPELITAFEKNMSVAEQYHLHQAVKRLTFPTEMGERVKIMALSKQFQLPLRAMLLHDRRREL